MKAVSEELSTIMLLCASLAIAAALYTFINSVYASSTVTVELVDSYCVNHTAYFVIRNGGAYNLTKDAFKCVESDHGCGSCIADDVFPAEGAGYIRAFDCTGGTHTFSLTGKTNGLQLVVYCS